MICACSNDHGTVVCDCGHTHDEHVFGSGCGYIYSYTSTKRPVYCTCRQYSQVHLRQVGESTRAYNKRVGYVAI